MNFAFGKVVGYRVRNNNPDVDVKLRKIDRC